MKNVLIFFAIIFAISAQEIVYYEEIREIPNHPDILLIDVRTELEVKETGTIPSSINIPSANLEWALGLIAPKFEALTMRTKPRLSDPIIFSCRSGKRALAAAQKAISLGYTKYYEGSWNEWCVKEEVVCHEEK